MRVSGKYPYRRVLSLIRFGLRAEARLQALDLGLQLSDLFLLLLNNAIQRLDTGQGDAVGVDVADVLESGTIESAG